MLSTYRSNDTPREVPLGIKAKIMTANAFFWIGFMFFIIGSIIGYAFSFSMDFKSLGFHPDQTTTGKIITQEATNCTENKREIYQYNFEFSTGHTTLQGSSYSSDFADSYNSIEVEYESKNPQNARIVGMRSAPFSAWIGLLLGISPLIGLAFLAFAVSRGFKNIYLVTNGMLTKGKVLGKEATNTKINGRTLFRMIFEFKTQNGHTAQAKCTTTEPEKVLDEAEELLVYDPRQPEKAVLLDTLNGSVKRFLMNT
jgi:hypothetical protein